MRNDWRGGAWAARHGRDVLLLILTWAAGCVDAIGYLALGHVFTANMTGNTILLGLHLAQEQGAAAVRSVVALAGFGAGLAVGALIVERARGRGAWPPVVTRALALEAALLAVFALESVRASPVKEVWQSQLLISLSAIAMGIQSAAVRRLNVPGIATTYVTGTLTSAVTSLVAGPRPSAHGSEPGAGRVAGVPAAGQWWRGVRLQFLALFVYGLGAMVSGLAQTRWPALVAVLPLGAVVSVVAAAALSRGALDDPG